MHRILTKSTLMVMTLMVMVIFMLTGCQAGEPASREAMQEADEVVRDLTAFLNETSGELSAAGSSQDVIKVMNSYVTNLQAYMEKEQALQEKYPEFSMNSVQMKMPEAKKAMRASYSNFRQLVGEDVFTNDTHPFKDADAIEDVMTSRENREDAGQSESASVVSNFRYAHAAYSLHQSSVILRSAVTNFTGRLESLENQYDENEAFKKELEKIKEKIGKMGQKEG